MMICNKSHRSAIRFREIGYIYGSREKHSAILLHFDCVSDIVNHCETGPTSSDIFSAYICILFQEICCGVAKEEAQ